MRSDEKGPPRLLSLFAGRNYSIDKFLRHSQISRCIEKPFNLRSRKLHSDAAITKDHVAKVSLRLSGTVASGFHDFMRDTLPRFFRQSHRHRFRKNQSARSLEI